MGLTCANIHLFTGAKRADLQEADVVRLLDDACDRIGHTQ
jgi:hypothetical protein